MAAPGFARELLNPPHGTARVLQRVHKALCPQHMRRAHRDKDILPFLQIAQDGGGHLLAALHEHGIVIRIEQILLLGRKNLRALRREQGLHSIAIPLQQRLYHPGKAARSAICLLFRALQRNETVIRIERENDGESCLLFLRGLYLKEDIKIVYREQDVADCITDSAS